MKFKFAVLTSYFLLLTSYFLHNFIIISDTNLKNILEDLMNLLNNDELPIGFGMALAKDTNAMNVFSSMNVAEQRNVIEHARHIDSKNEMQQFVSNLSQNSFK